MGILFRDNPNCILLSLPSQSIGNASVEKLLRPAFKSLTPLTSALDNGVVDTGSDVNDGLHEAGCALNSVTTGVGDITDGLVSGTGNALATLPQQLWHIVKALTHKSSLLASLLNALL